MDERLLLVCCTLAGGVFLAVVGALFGALAGFLARTQGRSPGSFLGLHVLRSVERVLQREIAPLSAGALVGAVDGAAFLGFVGVLFGWLASRTDAIPPTVFLAILLGIGSLAIVAAVVGTTAHLISRGGMRAAWAVCSGGLVGICIGIDAAGPVGVLVGAVVGLLVGLALSLLFRGHSPECERLTCYEEDEP
jgi:hypothetical protein